MPWKPITYTNTDDSLIAMLLFEDKAILLCNCSTTFFYWCWKAVIILVVSSRKFVDTFSLLFFFFLCLLCCSWSWPHTWCWSQMLYRQTWEKGIFLKFFFYALLSSRFSLRKLQTILTHVQCIEEQDPIYKKSLVKIF